MDYMHNDFLQSGQAQRLETRESSSEIPTSVYLLGYRESRLSTT